MVRAEQCKAQSLWEIMPFSSPNCRNQSLRESWILSDKDRDRSRYPKDGRKRHRLDSEMRNRISVSVCRIKVTTA